MKSFLFSCLISFLFIPVYSAEISGTVTDTKGNLLPFATILVKGTGVGTATNESGKYTLQLEPGDYVIVCQYVGFEKEEKTRK